MKLLIVELTRLRWRRAVIVLCLLGVVLPTLIWAGMAWETRPITDAERRQGVERMEEEQRYQQQAIDDCIAHPEHNFDPQNPPPADQVDELCREMHGFGSDGVTPETYFGREALTIENAGEVGIAVMTVLLGLALLVGATFAGADWSSGSLSNQLLFEPRRVRVWAAKAGAVATGGVVLALAGLATFWGLTWVLAAFRDISGTSGEWPSIAGASGRGLLFAACAGIGGYALTMLLRGTVGTLGTLLVVAIGGSILVASLPIDGNLRWILPNNVLGILQDGYVYYDYSDPACFNSVDGEEGCRQVLTLGEGVRFLGTLLVVGVALSVASFRHRDVP